MKLVIAEKPSVGRDIAKVLGALSNSNGYCEGNGYICTWAFGHLVTLYDCADYKEEWKSWKNIPVIPAEFKIKLSKNSGIKKQMSVIKKLMNRNDVTSIVCATDAGREGELIFRHIYNFLKCKKPIERLWINSMVEEDIKKGFNNLENGNSPKYINLYECAYAREKADWLVGMNMTRCFSNMHCAYGEKPLSIGRVQTPTLKMIVDREKEIKSFVKNYYYKAQIIYDDIVAEYDTKFENKAEAELIAEAVDGTNSIIQSVKKETKRKKAPMLFDITSLQKECNKHLGLNAQKTLDIAQSLYEKKLITYPRTDSKFLNASMENDTHELAERICNQRNIDIILNPKAVIDDTKVSDHHAIIPTVKTLNKFSITEEENNVLEMIMLRFIVAMSPDMLYEHITATIKAGQYIFKANANCTVSHGWKALDFEDGTSSISDDKLNKNINLFSYKENNVWNNVKSNVNSIETKPKQRFTDDTLLTAMENAGLKDFKNIDGIERVGLGTGATRAAIIEVLLDRGYVERKKKNLVPTERGIKLIDIVPNEISDVSMTISWEEQIAEIKNGNVKSDVFVKHIEDYVCDVIKNNYKQKDSVVRKELEKTGNICPECGSALVIRQGKYGAFEGCSNYPKCKYIKKKEKDQQPAVKTKGICPECGSALIEKKGRFGSFIGCSNYPKCKYIKKGNK
ncbi:DNA topoisomerase III [Thomasclavelia cocleata]|uniref:DNA topoisomerase n=1 Tax=Thomasclavelia cocleata TaxID=69824 RepID=A0A1I0CPX6_9FIRM|nr:DNA topoisomerase 3 [Thomasclavelia cocleata]MCR1960762.1 DNA topoisomerase 3 [Thomasclavelia cocleata]NDO42578.1 DNA topoisomerase III [Thomasclavelia cocleata]PJN81171.1 DNA topoisomerase III [Thomasclavelia cocleata]SET21094.1 DNA topoisomerase-3 [Thomasclavelia cocleata]